jgi:hypothetical protein
MLITSIITFTELLRIKNRSTLQNLFIATIFFSITDVFSNYIFLDYLDSERYFSEFAKFNQYIFYFLEISSIIFFYTNLYESKKYLNHAVIIFFISLAITLIYFECSSNNYSYFTFTLIILFELIYINFSFGFFLTKNLEIDYTEKINKLNFINYGLFVFVNFSTPFYFISVFLAKKYNDSIDLSFITYLGYIILYSSIIKSLRWKI